MKLMVCGSRSIVDTVWVFEQIDKLVLEQNIPLSELTLVDGGAKGVDTFAAHWANEKNVPIEWYRPDWGRYGRGAGPVRNKLMVEACDFCLILWDGKSKGTKNDIDLCVKLGKNHKVVTKTAQKISKCITLSFGTVLGFKNFLTSILQTYAQAGALNSNIPEYNHSPNF